MNLGKKLGIGMATAALSLSLVTAASANESSTSANGYGTLTGYSYLGGDAGGADTTVTKNNDNAYLVAGYSIQDKNGKTVVSYKELKSSRGDKMHGIGFTYAPDSSHVMYGTHGVQGGSTYGAKAVYTYTFFNR
ncbi:hypothetical protein ACQKOF_04030 [Lysinibacillus sp. NPDC093190]|uniref:hypothetical protein n=1 Tax=Lysinibacillus sp. NPDC093190 TaxID=3390575 RepID=UPI003D064C2B